MTGAERGRLEAARRFGTPAEREEAARRLANPTAQRTDGRDDLAAAKTRRRGVA